MTVGWRLCVWANIFFNWGLIAAFFHLVCNLVGILFYGLFSFIQTGLGLVPGQIFGFDWNYNIFLGIFFICVGVCKRTGWLLEILILILNDSGFLIQWPDLGIREKLACSSFQERFFWFLLAHLLVDFLNWPIFFKLGWFLNCFITLSTKLRR
jgi:hypothetical protein